MIESYNHRTTQLQNDPITESHYSFAQGFVSRAPLSLLLHGGASLVVDIR